MANEKAFLFAANSAHIFSVFNFSHGTEMKNTIIVGIILLALWWGWAVSKYSWQNEIIKDFQMHTEFSDF